MKSWELSKYFSELGKKGGLARAKKLSQKDRSMIAMKAGIASGKARKHVQTKLS